MNIVTKYFFNYKSQTKEVGWFRNALYLFIVYKFFIYITHFNVLFSSNRLIFHHVKHINWIVDFVYFLNNHYSVAIGTAFIFVALTLAIIGLLKKSSYVSNAILWLVFLNLSNFLYPTLTAGDFLLNQLLFFNIFFSTKEVKNINYNDIKIALHNTALIAIKIQICLAYFVAASFKIIDTSWLEGIAIFQTFQVPEFSNTFLSAIPFSVCKILTYLTILYQLSFAFLVWFRPFKIYLFSFGIMQHLLIAFGMGLFQFGIIMSICYILFLKYDETKIKDTLET